jgi:DNA-binding transcriptional MerR regulator
MNNEEKILKKLDNHDILFEKQGALLEEICVLIRKQGTTLEEHGVVLNEHTATLNEHSAILKEHSAILNEHTAILNEHTATLEDHSAILKEHSAKHEKHEASLEGLHQSVAIIEVEHGRKIGALFDGYSLLSDGVKQIQAVLPKLEKSADDVAIIKSAVAEHSKKFGNLRVVS